MTRYSNLPPAFDGRPGRSVAWLGALRGRVFVWLLMLAASLGLVNFEVRGEEEMPADFQVKAAFLINFPKYVEWPATAFAETNSPVTIAVFGDDNIANEVENMIGSGRSIGGRAIHLKRITREEEIAGDCHILFLGASQRQRTTAILEKIQALKILTVSESEDFLNKGGVINLARQGRKIRLQVNLAAAAKADLKISSRLLMAADVVKGKAN